MPNDAKMGMLAGVAAVIVVAVVYFQKAPPANAATNPPAAKLVSNAAPVGISMPVSK